MTAFAYNFLLRILLRVDAVLRGRGWPATGNRSARSVVALLALGVSCGMLYGGAMGTYDGRPLQVFYSAIKVPILLSATFAVSLPSFFVLNSLLGLRGEFLTAIGSLITTQAVLTIVLVGLAPLTLFWYRCCGEYALAVLFNALMFSVASAAAQVRLRRLFAPLIARDRRHRFMLLVWLITFAFVGIQMGWVLRPFIGEPAAPVQFFRQGAWGNAYVTVGELIWRRIAR